MADNCHQDRRCHEDSINYSLRGDKLIIRGDIPVCELECKDGKQTLKIPFCKLGLTNNAIINDHQCVKSNSKLIKFKADRECELLTLKFRDAGCTRLQFKLSISIVTGFESITRMENAFYTMPRNGNCLPGTFPSPLLASFPPDPINAAGPEEVVAAVNTSIVIYRKKDVGSPYEVYRQGSNLFFGPPGELGNYIDPWIVWDQYINRFVIIIISTASGGTATFIQLAISKSSTFSEKPTRDDWFFYSFDLTNQGNIRAQFPTATSFPDYPKLGYDKDYYYISSNNFENLDPNLPGYYGVGLFAIEKKSILKGGPANVPFNILIPDPNPEIPFDFLMFSLFPVQNYDCKTKVMYFVMTNELLGSCQSDNRIVIVSTPSGTWDPLYQIIQVNPYTQTSPGCPVSFVQVPQPDPTAGTLSTVGVRIMSAVVRNNKLWTAHNNLNQASGRFFVRWYEFQVDVLHPQTSASIVQQGDITDTPLLTDNTWMAHIQVDKNNNMGIVFSIGGTERFASIGYSGHRTCDPKNSSLPVQILKNGEDNYATFCNAVTRSNRWGDYAGLAIDPCDQTKFWFFHEYAKLGPLREISPSQNWGTFFGSFRIGCEKKCKDDLGISGHKNPEFKLVENKLTTNCDCNSDSNRKNARIAELFDEMKRKHDITT